MSEAAIPAAVPADQVAQLATLQPIPARAVIPLQFVRDGDALQAVINEECARMVSWPDGSVGFVVFWPGEDRDARLREVYALARAMRVEIELRRDFTVMH